jgi:hypothetical protein
MFRLSDIIVRYETNLPLGVDDGGDSRAAEIISQPPVSSRYVRVRTYVCNQCYKDKVGVEVRNLWSESARLHAGPFQPKTWDVQLGYDCISIINHYTVNETASDDRFGFKIETDVEGGLQVGTRTTAKGKGTLAQDSENMLYRSESKVSFWCPRRILCRRGVVDVRCSLEIGYATEILQI